MNRVKIVILIVVLLIAAAALYAFSAGMFSPSVSGGASAQAEISPQAGELAAEIPQETAEPTEEPVRYESGAGKVIISEVMSKNKATVQDADGDFSDWIEIENVTDRDINLFEWTVSDGSSDWQLPEFTLFSNSRAIIWASKKDRADTELHASFSLKQGDEITLLDRNRELVDSCEISEEEANFSLIRNEDKWQLCAYPTPGYENSAAGYEQFCCARVPAGPVIINEVCVDNKSDFEDEHTGFPDWVEIKNISGEEVDLSDYYLSDDLKALKQYNFNDILGPGETLIVLCDKHAASYKGNMPIAPFSLNSENENLYLTSGKGHMEDFAALKGIPYGKTFGRIDGREGFFYLSEKSPGSENGNGVRIIPEAPVPSVKDGVYNNVENITVELSSAGQIYYTLDCTEPNEESMRYEGPIVLDKTTVIRAISIEEGFVSPVSTLSYIINENHTLPVASLVCGNEYFNHVYQYGMKNDTETPAVLSFYEDDGSFTVGCGIRLNGASSLVLPKKNINVRFRGSYGAEKLEYDLFDGGVTKFTNLVLRAGQDQNNTIVRNEACYKLAQEFTDSVYVLRYKYCVLYKDGRYNGIYAIIEKPNEAYVAEEKGVSKSSVTTVEAPAYSNDELYKSVMHQVFETDIREPENYAELKKHIDIDSLIDWSLLQGFFGNYDLASGNLRYASSSEDGGQWKLMLYDLDCAFSSVGFVVNNVFTFDSQIANINYLLLRNQDYRQRVLERASVAYSGLLTVQHMEEIIDSLCAEVAPEVERDSQFSHMNTESWQAHLREWKNMMENNNWDQAVINNFCHILNVTSEERTQYFGDR